MKIVILAAGSRGDIQPYLALAAALNKLGAEAYLATFENFESFVQSYGVQCIPIRGDVTKVMQTEQAQYAMQSDNPLKLMISFQKLKELGYGMQKDFLAACEGAEGIIFHPGAAIGHFIAKEKGIPGILATPFPMTPTSDYPALIFYNQPRLGKWFNLFSHQIFEQIMWSAAGASIKQLWIEKYGRLPNPFGPPFKYQNSQMYPTVIGCSPAVFPTSSKWSSYVRCDGYWFLDQAEGWQPDQKLMEFLSSGPAPVYIGFGSIGGGKDTARTTEIVLDAVHRSGCRAILATGWSGLSGAKESADILVVDQVPHAWLFPQMAAVVHHGGAGTTAAGLRAGKPTVVIPHGNDQFAWGKRVYELKVGSKPIPRKKLSVQRLSDAITFALSDPIKENAKVIGEKIRQENGTEKTAQFIMEIVTNRDSM